MIILSLLAVCSYTVCAIHGFIKIENVEIFQFNVIKNFLLGIKLTYRNKGYQIAMEVK